LRTIAKIRSRFIAKIENAIAKIELSIESIAKIERSME
jgi:hypothetical protein